MLHHWENCISSYCWTGRLGNLWWFIFHCIISTLFLHFLFCFPIRTDLFLNFQFFISLFQGSYSEFELLCQKSQMVTIKGVVSCRLDIWLEQCCVSLWASLGHWNWQSCNPHSGSGGVLCDTWWLCSLFHQP